MDVRPPLVSGRQKPDCGYPPSMRARSLNCRTGILGILQKILRYKRTLKYRRITIYKRISKHKRVDNTQMIKGAVLQLPCFCAGLSIIDLSD